MGYDLHITRKAHWADEQGPAISEAEWRAVVEADPELSVDTETQYVTARGEWVFAAWRGEPGVLGWFDGEITAKHPEQPLVVKMVQIAEGLGASVQGDDGEVYRADGTSYHREPPDTSAPPPGQGLLGRIAEWFRTRPAPRQLRQAAPAFTVGARVRNVFGDTGTVIEVDPRANGGLGRVRVRLDDGREQSLALAASGLELEGSGT